MPIIIVCGKILLFLNEVGECWGSFDTSSLRVYEGEDLLFDTFIVGFDSLLETVGAIFVCEVRYDGDRLVSFRFSRDLGNIHNDLSVEDFLIDAFIEIVRDSSN